MTLTSAILTSSTQTQGPVDTVSSPPRIWHPQALLPFCSVPCPLLSAVHDSRCPDFPPPVSQLTCWSLGQEHLFSLPRPHLLSLCVSAEPSLQHQQRPEGRRCLAGPQGQKEGVTGPRAQGTRIGASPSMELKEKLPDGPGAQLPDFGLHPAAAKYRSIF